MQGRPSNCATKRFTMRNGLSFLSPLSGLRFRSCLMIGLLGLATMAFAQERGFTGSVGGGYTPLMGNLSNHLDNGWNFRASGGNDMGCSTSTELGFTCNGLGGSPSVSE